MQQELISVLVVFYIIQIIACFAVLAMQPDDDLKVFKTKKQFIVFAFVPYLWTIPLIKVSLIGLKQGWKNLS